jgi:hypothetical protein
MVVIMTPDKEKFLGVGFVVVTVVTTSLTHSGPVGVQQLVKGTCSSSRRVIQASNKQDGSCLLLFSSLVA